MNALFLAGGMGTRLRPLTDRLPKPMVPIVGRPLLERNMEKLRLYGVSDMVLSTCYRPDVIQRHFGHGADFGLTIRYADELKPLGTGGAIKNAAAHMHDTFLVFNADIMCDIDYEAMLRTHRARGADVTIAATYVEDPTAYGVLEYNTEGLITRFTEKPKAADVRSHYINAGVYIMEKHVLDLIPAGRPVSIEREIFPLLLALGKKVAIYKDIGYWLDIGTPEKYMQAQQDVFDGRYAIEETDFSDADIYSNFGTSISGRATIVGPLYLGRGVRIEAGAVVGPNVAIGDYSVIGRSARLSDCVLWNNVAVEDGAVLNGAVVTDDCYVTGSGMALQDNKVLCVGQHA